MDKIASFGGVRRRSVVTIAILPVRARLFLGSVMDWFHDLTDTQMVIGGAIFLALVIVWTIYGLPTAQDVVARNPLLRP